MKSMNKKEGKKIAVIAAIVMGLMMFAFLPVASAEVTSFEVTPSTGIAGAVDSYNVLVTTTGVNTLNITIPAGFLAVTPTTGGVEVARVDFWNTSIEDYYGYGTITSNNANPAGEVDVYCKMRVGGVEVVFERTENVNYNPGETTTFVVEWPEAGTISQPISTATVTITLPRETEDGSISITIDCADLDLLEDVHIAIRQFVRNPTVAGVYDFYAEEEVAHVNIHYQARGDIAYLKKGPQGLEDYDLYICAAPATIAQQGTYTASDYWSPDGDTVAVTVIDIGGVDAIAYLKKGAGDTDYYLQIYTKPTTFGEVGTLLASDYWSPTGNTVAITAIDITGDGVDEIAYLKKGPEGAMDYNLWIYTAPATISEAGTLLAADYWSPDGNTVAITAIGGGDEIAYLKKGPGGATDYNLYIHRAPANIGEEGELIAADYWIPDGNTEAVTAIGGGDEIAYLKGAGTNHNLYVYTAPAFGTLIASDYWSPDGLTVGISALP